MKIALGTAQFGLDYGVTNQEGQVSIEVARGILDCLDAVKLSHVDTAYLYGGSEQALGEVLQGRENLSIITKTCKFEKIDRLNVKNLFHNCFQESLRRLNRCKVEGLLLHSLEDVKQYPFLWDEMRMLRGSGMVDKIGFSIYKPGDLETVFKYSDVDIVQLPLNVFDQRFLAHGSLQELKKFGIEIHVRSIFLQGILLAGCGKMPAHFLPARSKYVTYHEELQKRGLSQMQGAVGFIKTLEEFIDFVVVGFVTAKEALEFCQVFYGDVQAIDFKPYAINEDFLVNPSRWPAKDIFWEEIK